MEEKTMSTDIRTLEDMQAQLKRIETLTLIAAKDVLTLDEASLVLDLKKETVRGMMRNKVLPYYKPNHRHIYFKKSELNDWMLQNRFNTQAEVESYATLHCLNNKLMPTARKKRMICTT